MFEGEASVPAGRFADQRSGPDRIDGEGLVEEPGQQRKPGPVVDVAVAGREDVLRVATPVILEEAASAEHHEVGRLRRRDQT